MNFLIFRDLFRIFLNFLEFILDLLGFLRIKENLVLMVCHMAHMSVRVCMCACLCVCVRKV